MDSEPVPGPRTRLSQKPESPRYRPSRTESRRSRRGEADRTPSARTFDRGPTSAPHEDVKLPKAKCAHTQSAPPGYWNYAQPPPYHPANPSHYTSYVAAVPPTPCAGYPPSTPAGAHPWYSHYFPYATQGDFPAGATFPTTPLPGQFSCPLPTEGSPNLPVPWA